MKTLVLLLVLLIGSHLSEEVIGDGDRASNDQEERALTQVQYLDSNPVSQYPLGRCEGDCDYNSQCSGTLVCFQRGPHEPVPGCTGGDTDWSRTDYCVDPDDIPPPTIAPRLQTPPPTLRPTPKPASPPTLRPTPKPASPPTLRPTSKPTSKPTAAPVRQPTSIPEVRSPTRTPTAVPPSQKPSAGKVASPPSDLENYGMTPPIDKFPLQQCQGDCDTDDDCDEDMICFQRNANTPVPGCEGVDTTISDFCIIPPPTRAPTFAVNLAYVEDFRLKLYWSPGYYWQEESFERKWCMECRNNNCYDGRRMHITKCDSDNQRFDFVLAGTEDDVLIKLHDKDLCFERLERVISLRTCDKWNPLQRFFAKVGTFDKDRFEISQRGASNLCLTQRHHPKEDEEVVMEPCDQARHSRTSYWNRF